MIKLLVDWDGGRGHAKKSIRNFPYALLIIGLAVKPFVIALNHPTQRLGTFHINFILVEVFSSINHMLGIVRTMGF